MRDLPLDANHALWLRTDENDTTLVDPNRITVVNGQLIVLDARNTSLVALSPRDGKTIWRYEKRGAGPGEMKLPSFVTALGTDLLVADNDTRRFYVLSAQGKFVREMPVPNGLFVAGLCAVSPSTVVMHYAAMNGPQLMTVDLVSGRTSVIPEQFTPAPDNPNATIYDLAGAGSNGCVASRKSAPGWSLFKAGAPSRTVPFVETLSQRKYVPYSQIKDTTQLPIPFSLDVAVDGASLFVWFGGKTSCAFRCVRCIPATVDGVRSHDQARRAVGGEHDPYHGRWGAALLAGAT